MSKVTPVSKVTPIYGTTLIFMYTGADLELVLFMLENSVIQLPCKSLHILIFILNWKII